MGDTLGASASRFSLAKDGHGLRPRDRSRHDVHRRRRRAATAGPRSSRSATAPRRSRRWCSSARTASSSSARRPSAAAITEPDALAREFKRRLGDPTPHPARRARPYSAEALMAGSSARRRRRGRRARGRPPDRGGRHPPGQLGPVQARPAPPGGPRSPGSSDAVLRHRAGGRRRALRRRTSGSTRATSSPSTTSAAARSTPPCCARPPTASRCSAQPEGIERLGGIDFDEAVFAPRARRARRPRSTSSTTTTPTVRPRRGPAARGVRRGQGGAVGRHRRVDPGAAARPADRGPPHPGRVRGDDPAGAARDGRRRCAGRSRRPASTPDDLKAVLLVGGSSRIPLVAELVARRARPPGRRRRPPEARRRPRRGARRRRRHHVGRRRAKRPRPPRPRRRPPARPPQRSRPRRPHRPPPPLHGAASPPTRPKATVAAGASPPPSAPAATRTGSGGRRPPAEASLVQGAALLGHRRLRRGRMRAGLRPVPTVRRRRRDRHHRHHRGQRRAGVRLGLGPLAVISDVQLTAEGVYLVDYAVEGYDPVVFDEAAGVGSPEDHHIHFFFDTTPEANAGRQRPAAGPLAGVGQERRRPAALRRLHARATRASSAARAPRRSAPPSATRATTSRSGRATASTCPRPRPPTVDAGEQETGHERHRATREHPSGRLWNRLTDSLDAAAGGRRAARHGRGRARHGEVDARRRAARAHGRRRLLRARHPRQPHRRRRSGSPRSSPSCGRSMPTSTTWPASWAATSAPRSRSALANRSTTSPCVWASTASSRRWPSRARCSCSSTTPTPSTARRPPCSPSPSADC